MADATDGAVVRVDPYRNRRTVAVLGTGPACGGMAALDASVWIASGCNQNTVTRIETKTARAAAVIHVPGVAFDVAAGSWLDLGDHATGHAPARGPANESDRGQAASLATLST